MSKPNWRDAPEWAQWLVQDWDGEWRWFELEPYAHGEGYWQAPTGRCASADSVEGTPWYEILEARPDGS